jgi:hypothetical protein
VPSRDGPQGEGHFQAADVITVFVREKDAIELLRRNAALL